MKKKGLIFLTLISILCGILTSTEVSAQPYYVIFHDNVGNVITYDRWQEGYTLHSTYPAYFLDDSYVNSGWSTAPGGAGTVYNDGDVLPTPSSNVSLYAVVRRGYWITFDSQGGTPTESQIVFEGQTSTKPADPVRSGYTFAGWELNGSAYTFGAAVTSDIILKAKWTPTSANYLVRVWIEHATHPVRGSVSDALTNAASDYSYVGSYTKSGVPGSQVSITNEDHNRSAVTAITHYTNDGGTFPIYFCDDNYGSKALSMTNASIASANAAGGISDDGSTIVDVYYRSLVYSMSLSDKGILNGTEHSYTFNARPGEVISAAVERAGVVIDPVFLGILQQDITSLPYMMTTKPEDGADFGGEDIYWDATTIEINNIKAQSILTDGFSVSMYLYSRPKGDHRFIRNFYYQTLASAKAGNETGYDNSSLSHYTLAREVVYARTNTTMMDGCKLDELDGGYTLFFHQIVQRERDDLPFYADLYAKNSSSTKYYSESSISGWKHIVGKPARILDIFNILPYTNTADMSRDGGKWENLRYKIEIFYVRNSYELTFVTGTTKCSVNPIHVFYEDSFKNQSSKVVYSDATGTHPFEMDKTVYADDNGVIWVFKGWYEDDTFSGSPVDFSTTSLTMPAANFQLYAKWEKKKISVTFDAGNGTIGGNKTYTVTLDSGLIPTNIGNATPPAGQNFYCWTYNGFKYEFNKPVYDDAIISARYYNDKVYKLTYSVGAGSGKAPVDADKYLVGAEAIVAAPGPEMLPPSWKKFDHWVDKNGNIYNPGDMVTLSENISLTAAYEGYLTGLTIETSGMKPGDSSIFTVCPEGSSTPVNTVVITADASGKGSVVIAELASGRYTVTETPWNWTYTSTGSKVLTQDLEENSVFTFGSAAATSRPANDEKSINNWHE